MAKLSLAALALWLMVLPAAVILAAGLLSSIQPGQYEPARTSLALLNWVRTHVSHLAAAMLFIILPGVAIFTGCGVLAGLWRADQAFRQDARDALRILRGQAATCLLAAATALAGAIAFVAVAHIMTD